MVDGTPLALSGDEGDFEVAFNTHSVNLGFDPTKVSVLRCDRGNEHTPTTWDGPAPGDHNHSVILSSNDADQPSLEVPTVANVIEEKEQYDE